MGISIDESLSPSLHEKVSYIGTLLHSFPAADTAICKLLDLTLGRKRIERLTERIGRERVAERDTEVECFQQLTLMEKLAGRSGVAAPEAGAVMYDDGEDVACVIVGEVDGPRVALLQFRSVNGFVVF